MHWEGNPPSRRRFLKGALASLAVPLVIPARALGRDGNVSPSERVTMGFIGVGTQGGGHLYGGGWTYVPGGYVARADVQVLGVCDVRQASRDRGIQKVNDHYSKQSPTAAYRSAQGYIDFRELLARPDIDAVLIGTPIHWHAMMTVMAMKAGKDVYCEKPTALTVAESRAAHDTCRRYGRVFQAGTQQRSEYGGKFRWACELVRSGRIGRLKEVWGYEHGGGFAWSRNFGPPRPVPKDQDWELFIGPAPWSPYDGNFDAHRFGFGGINWGQHHYDIVQWGIEGADDTDPTDFSFVDGKLAMRYENGVTVYAARYPDSTIGLGKGVGFAGEGGCVFVGTEGVVAVDRQQILSNPASILKEPLGPRDTRLYHAQSHSVNFLECVRSRKATITDVGSTHRAAKLLLLAGIAEQLHRPLKWNPEKEQFINDSEADRMLSVAYRAPWRL